jgi:hypothetical protein
VDKDKASYVFRYYHHLLNTHERMASRHLTATLKATRGRDDAAAQEEATHGPSHFRDMLSSDPEVLRLARDGFQAFVMNTAERIMKDHSKEIAFNCCPRCGRVAPTPKARQCRFCRHDWHDRTRTSKFKWLLRRP